MFGVTGAKKAKSDDAAADDDKDDEAPGTDFRLVYPRKTYISTRLY
jgi:hypothetical protein